jgi:large subunit ribosomal protein L9
MKIILIAAVQNLGKIGDVVEVKNGYAKNFLIPNKKAICFTVNNNKIFEAKRQEFEQENIKNLEKADSLKNIISSKDIIIIENASDDGRLYGSVNSGVIADKINEIAKQKLVSRLDIFLKKPIKEIGIYQVKISPHSEVSFDVRLIVTRSESEIDALLKAEKKGNKGSESEESVAQVEVVRSDKPKKSKKDEVPEEEVVIS